MVYSSDLSDCYKITSNISVMPPPVVSFTESPTLAPTSAPTVLLVQDGLGVIVAQDEGKRARLLASELEQGSALEYMTKRGWWSWLKGKTGLQWTEEGIEAAHNSNEFEKFNLPEVGSGVNSKQLEIVAHDIADEQ